MTYRSGWLWVGIAVTTVLCVACGGDPAIGQSRGSESVAARVSVDDQIDGEALVSESERIKRALFEVDEHSASRVRQVGGWNWRGNLAKKSPAKPIPRFNPFRRQKSAPPQDPFISTETDTETETEADSSEESETEPGDSTEVMPSGQPEHKSQRGAAPQSKRSPAPQSRKRLQRYQSATPSALPSDQPSNSGKPEVAKPASPVRSRSEVIRKNVSVNEADSESHLRSLFEDPSEGEPAVPKSNDSGSKSAAVTQVDATSEVEIQRLKPRRTIATRPPAATVPRATLQQKADDIPAARAKVDQNAVKPQEVANGPVIRPLRTSNNLVEPVRATPKTGGPAPSPTADETASRLPVAQSTIRTTASTASPQHYVAANRPFQIDPPAGWSAATKVPAQNSSRLNANGDRLPRETDESLSRPEPLAEVAGQLQFPAHVNRLGSDDLPSDQQPVAIDSIEGDANSLQTTGTAQDGTNTLDSALFVQDNSAADQEPAKIEDEFPEPVVSAELAKQNQSPWLWWMVIAFGAGFSVCLLWCIRFRNTAAA